jgi:hypothetical protein
MAHSLYRRPVFERRNIMRFSFHLRNWTSTRSSRGREQHRPAAPRFRPLLEALEERSLPSTYYAATTSDLIADINAANKAGGANTIMLTAPTTSPYVLTAVDNTTNGANGLPVISGGGKKSADNLTIVGNGDTIERSTASGTPDFRVFDVAKGNSLTLQNVTLAGGLAFGSGAAADGGAIYNQGTLTLSGATVQGNVAQGSNGAAGAQFTSSNLKKLQKGPSLDGQAGANAEGGGIWSSGSVTLQGGTLIGSTDSLHTGNEAIGGQGGAAGYSHDPGIAIALGNGGAGGAAFGGGLYEAGGSVTVTNATLSANTARGGAGGDNTLAGYVSSQLGAAAGGGGGGSGGGLYVASGTLDMEGVPSGQGPVTVESNHALGGAGGIVVLYYHPGQGGEGSGGGIYIADANTATLAHVDLKSNTAQGGNGGVTASRHSGAHGGSAFGGGLYVANGTVTLTNDTVNGNYAIGGWGITVGGNTDFSGHSVQASASGGGLYINGGTVSLDSATVANTTNNYDENYPLEDDIEGSYKLI